MALELKNSEGLLFKNEKKTEDKHPSWKGQIKTPSGETLDIALWEREGKKGQFFSVKVSDLYNQDKEDKETAPAEEKKKMEGNPKASAPDDSLPF